MPDFDPDAWLAATAPAPADPNALPADSSAPTSASTLTGGVVRARTTTYFPGERYSDPDTDAGRTATGGPLVPASPDMAGTVAVDPAKYPYGTIFRTPDGSVHVAADTGGAVKRMTASRGRADVLDFASPTPLPDYQDVEVIPPTTDYKRLSPAGKAEYHRQAAAMFTPVHDAYPRATPVNPARGDAPAAAHPAFDPDAYLAQAGAAPAADRGPLVSVPDTRPATVPAADPLKAASDFATGFTTEVVNAPVRVAEAATSAAASITAAGARDPEILSPAQKETERTRLLADLGTMRADDPRAQAIADRLTKLADVREEPLSPEDQERAAKFRAISASIRGAADQSAAAQQNIREAVGLTGGASDPLAARMGESLGKVPDMLLPGVGLPLAFGEARAEGVRAGYEAAKQAGASEEDARAAGEKAGNRASLKLAATLPLYGAGGGAASKLVDRVLPETTPALARTLANVTGQSAANVTASAGLRAAEGGDPLSLESLPADLAFGVMGGRGSAREPVDRAMEARRAGADVQRIEPTERPSSPPVAESATPAERPAPEATRTAEPPPAPSTESTPSPDPTPPRERVEPAFAPTADAFLEGEGSAVRVPKGETPPPELAETPHVETPDGGRVYFDPGTHAPEDFAARTETPAEEFAPKATVTSAPPESRTPSEPPAPREAASDRPPATVTQPEATRDDRGPGFLTRQMREERMGSEAGAVKIPQGVADTVEGLRNELDARPGRDLLAAGKDASENRAGLIGRQAGNSVRLDFGSQKELANPKSQASRDLAAMPFVIEAGGDLARLRGELAKVQGSVDPALARDLAPVVQHAIDNFPRLDAKKANAEAIYAKQRAIERRHGIETPEVANYVNRRLELPENRRALEPVSLFGGPAGGGSGGGRYFVKGRAFETLGDAIQAGYKPKSTNLADLVHNRVETGQRIVQTKRLINRQRTLLAPDGRPIIGDLITRGPLLNGKTEQVMPPGYEGVRVSGKQELAVHKQYAPVVRALYGDSRIRDNSFGRMALKWTGFAKHGTLVLDTFHAFRVSSKEAFYGYQRPFSYGEGLSVLEYSDRDLSRAVAAGDLTQPQADYARRYRPLVDELVQAGLNVGKVADNMEKEVHSLVERIPVAGKVVTKFNGWLFQKLQRGATVQTAVKNFERNLARFPERGRDGNARQTAKEMNEVFGNLGSQGLFKGKTWQDAVRTVLLAPQWTESQFKAEVRGIGQTLRAPVDLARGALRGRLRLGTVAQGQVSSILALLAAGQVANYLSTGHTTDQNEEGHKFDIWIPGGAKGRGLWFNPLEMAAEFSHMAMRYHAKRENPVDIATHVLSNKLSPLARGVKDALSGRDYAGRPYASDGDRFRAAATDALPLPMPAGPLIEKDPRQPTGYRMTRQPASLERQLLQSIGLKTAFADSPAQKMNQLAQPFRPDKSYVGGASEYGELKRALDNDDDSGAKAEILALSKTHDGDAIAKAIGMDSKGKVKPQRFTDNAEHEKAFLASLTPVQKAVYHEAQLDHEMNARKLQRLMKEMWEGQSGGSNSGSRLVQDGGR